VLFIFAIFTVGTSTVACFFFVRVINLNSELRNYTVR